MLQGCAGDQNCQFESGDILLIRTGHVDWRLTMDKAQQEAITETAGIEQTEEVLRWHWDNGFAAVAADKYVQCWSLGAADGW